MAPVGIQLIFSLITNIFSLMTTSVLDLHSSSASGECWSSIRLAPSFTACTAGSRRPKSSNHCCKVYISNFQYISNFYNKITQVWDFYTNSLLFLIFFSGSHIAKYMFIIYHVNFLLFFLMITLFSAICSLRVSGLQATGSAWSTWSLR